MTDAAEDKVAENGMQQWARKTWRDAANASAKALSSLIVLAGVLVPLAAVTTTVLFGIRLTRRLRG